MATDASETNRLDLWLKYVCLFRTRSEAGTAVRGGHVKLNGNRAKPSSTIRVDDAIEIVRGDRIQQIRVRGIPSRQAPRKEARDHYDDLTPEPKKKEAWPSEPERVTSGKLNKKDRRELRRLKGR